MAEEKKKPAPDPTRLEKEIHSRDLDFAMRPKKHRMSYQRQRAKEEDMIEAIDQLRQMKRMAPIVKKLLTKKIPLDQAFRDTSQESFLMLMKMAFSDATSEKVKADILKHFLALAGFNPAQKHQIERVDPNTPKEALLSMIVGAKDDLAKEGIDLVEESTSSQAEEDDEESEDGYEV